MIAVMTSRERLKRVAPIGLPKQMIRDLEAWVKAENAAHPEDPMSRARLVRAILAKALDQRHADIAALEAAARLETPRRIK